MTRRAEKGAGTQGATAEARSLATLLAPLVAGMTTTRQQLLAWVQAAGLVALDAVFREEAASLAGPKGRHDPTRRSSLGHDTAAADLRGPEAERGVSAGAQPGGRGSDPAVGGGVSARGSADGAGHGATRPRGFDAGLCAECGGAAAGDSESGDQQERRQSSTRPRHGGSSPPNWRAAWTSSTWWLCSSTVSTWPGRR